ncbi:MAG: TrkH family potassium uptake protein [Bacteroidales bacterium]|nr:TrkH family potassium uptake protein [Bacteroidales bacterium]
MRIFFNKILAKIISRYRFYRLKFYRFKTYNFREFALGLTKKLSFINLILSSLILVTYLYRYSFGLNYEVELALDKLIFVSLILLFFSLFICWVLLVILKQKIRIIVTELLLFLFLFFTLLIYKGKIPFFEKIFLQWYLKFCSYAPFYSVFLIFISEVSKRSLRLLKMVNYSTLLLLSFFTMIFLGTLLLLLPVSTYNGISFTDAFFTSTSAVCVTGLTVVDTANTFTFFGKTVILILIQLGGLGIMTFTTFFGLMLQRSTSFREKMMIKEIIESDTLSELTKSLFKIIFFTFAIESMGAVLIFLTLDSNLTVIERIKFSVFHAVSAFCNAGFSTYSKGLMDLRVYNNYLLYLIISFLVILGGIGYPVLLNYYKLFKHYFRNLFRVLMHKPYIHKPNIVDINTRIVVITTLILIVLGTLFILIFEYNNTLKGYNFFGKLVHSYFASVTPRTAGFNTIDYSNVLPITALFTILLMWIGASPSSTGGGIKTSTFALAIMNIISFSKSKPKIEIFYREIAFQSIRKAFAVIFLSFILIGLSLFFMVFYDENNHSFLKIMFEVFSAFGTVGLSMGITPELSVECKWVLILTMYFGRVGLLSFFMAVIHKVAHTKYKYPESVVIIN